MKSFKKLSKRSSRKSRKSVRSKRSSRKSRKSARSKRSSRKSRKSVRSKRSSRKNRKSVRSKRSSIAKKFKNNYVVDNNIFTNVKYKSKFIEKYKNIFQHYMDSDCFKENENTQDVFSYNPENSKLYILGKKTGNKDDKTFNIKKVNYNVASFMTIIKDKNNYSLWNACTVCEYRNKKYFKQLFNYFLNTIDLNKSKIQTYVEFSTPEKNQIYEKLGLKIKDTVQGEYYLLEYSQ